ncbi:MAG TPA: DUF349 domain-containing protein [Mycobacteriales bacterium]|nr:DUF349 domain-containing protein [Mycobacteriales bacterium]
MTDFEQPGTPPWGRIADDGTVYVRTRDGERVIGSWQAGTTEEGLAFYGRRYEELAADVALLEGRAGSPASDPKAVGAAARRLRESIPAAAAIGDLDALLTRIDAVLAKVDERLAEKAAERARAAEAAADRKRALVAEAQQLSAGNNWRAGSERFRAMVEEWKAIRGVDRRTDSDLWAQFASARRAFDTRRRAHFAERDSQAEAAAARKAELAAQAEKLQDSTEWGPTAGRFRELMTEWKAAGRAKREAETELWQRFKAAQDEFFSRRSAHFAARDTELAANLEAKQALVAEAESIDAGSDPEGARKRLKTIHDRWEKIGHVPRDARSSLEQRLGDAERRIRDASAAARKVVTSESPLVIRLRESVTKLEARLDRARHAGDHALASETEASLATQREWLAQAERATD